MKAYDIINTVKSSVKESLFFYTNFTSIIIQFLKNYNY